MPQVNRKILFCLALLVTFLLYACSDDKHLKDLKTYVASLKPSVRAKKPSAALIASNIPQSVQFEAVKNRSPFVIAGYDGSNSSNPLQVFPTSVLNFKGTVTDLSGTSAYIEAPDNKLYQVKIGDIIGDHYGKITSISPERIEVEEPGTGNGKQASKRIVALQLKDES